MKKSGLSNTPQEKRWRLEHLPIILSAEKLKNAHKNVQKHSKTFILSVDNFGSTSTITAKNVIFPCTLQSVLGLHGIMVKCTAAIFFLT